MLDQLGMWRLKMYPIEGFFNYHADTKGKVITIYLDGSFIQLNLKYFKLLVDRKFQVGEIWYKVVKEDKQLFVMRVKK